MPFMRLLGCFGGGKQCTPVAVADSEEPISPGEAQYKSVCCAVADQAPQDAQDADVVCRLEPPYAAAALPFEALTKADASHVNDALLKVGTLVQRFVEMRPGAASLKALHQALRLITEEWQGAFARIHIVSSDNALLLAGAPARLPDLSRPLGYPMESEPKLTSLHRPNLAMGQALASSSGCYSWVKDACSSTPPPPDYLPFVAAGARAIISAVVKLSGDSCAVLTFGFAHNGAGAAEVLHDLWPTYLKLITVGMATLLVSPSLPQYLTLASELNEALDLDSAMVSVVRQLRQVAGQTATRQLWFRIALTSRQNSRTAILFDVPSESLALPRTSQGGMAGHFPLSPLSGRCRTPAGGHSAASPGRLFRVRSTPSGSDLRLLAPLQCDGTGIIGVGGESGSSVLRTTVAMEHSLLYHVLEKRKQAMVPNVQKLLNHGGGVATDIFAVGHIRPPAAVLLLPLLHPNTRSASTGSSSVCSSIQPASSIASSTMAPSHATSGGVSSSPPGSFDGCFGAVYCMSSVPTDFADVQQQLVESIVDVLSPHLHAALSREPLATDYEAIFTGPSPSSVAPGMVAGTAGMRARLSEQGHLYLTKASTASSLGQHAGSSPAEHADSAYERTTTLSDSTLSGSGSGGGDVTVPAACTNALVTGLTDKINTHRLVHNLDLGSPSSSLDDLHILGLLGSGGYGYVFRGKWRGMMAAIKLLKCSRSLDDANKEVLKHAHEIAILSSVSHPNIIQAYTFLTDVNVSDVVDTCLSHVNPDLCKTPAYAGLLALRDTTCHIEVLELCDRGCLFDMIVSSWFFAKPPPYHSLTTSDVLLASAASTGGAHHHNHHGYGEPGTLSASNSRERTQPEILERRLDLPALLLTLVELASALAHLHSLGIVHCDIKPDNVLLRSSTNDVRGFTVKLADFGLSRVQDDDGGMEFPCNSCGTMAYVAPEALAAKNKVNHAIDVYSFGILMYELYTNQRPYAKLRPPNFIHGVTVLGIRPQFPRGAHVGFAELAKMCWDPIPSRRPVFDDVVTALNSMLTEVVPAYRDLRSAA